MTLRAIYDTLPPASVDKWLGYLDRYEPWFSPYRGAIINVLEIGVQNGGSLDLWKQYFGLSARIVGVDIDPTCKRFRDEDRDMHVMIGNQGDAAFLESVHKTHGPFDIVIDDGSHCWDHQITAFNILYSKTADLYCVEDTHTSYWNGFGHTSTRDFISIAKDGIDRLHSPFILAGTPEVYGDADWAEKIGDRVDAFRAQTLGIHFYDSLVIFEKGKNPLPDRRRRP